MNRRLLDMLAGWSNYCHLVAEGNLHDDERAQYKREGDLVDELFEEASALDLNDGKGLAHFVFRRVLYLILDGKPLD